MTPILDALECHRETCRECSLSHVCATAAALLEKLAEQIAPPPPTSEAKT